MQITSFQYNFGLFRQIVWLQLGFLLLLSIFRALLFFIYSPDYDSGFTQDIINAFWLGLRIDFVLVTYLLILPVLLIIANQIFRNAIKIENMQRFMTIYFIVVYLLVSAIIGMDFAFYSYFYEHINILIFGIFEDDTWALVEIARKNYNLFVITALVMIYVLLLVAVVRKILSRGKPVSFSLKPKYQVLAYFFLVGLIFVSARGSVGTFPLLKLIPDVSTDRFINSLPKNGVFSLQKAGKQYKKSKSGSYGLIKAMGYGGNMKSAFKDFLQKTELEQKVLLHNIDFKTKKNRAVEKRPPHVVVVMVEGFNSALLAYQSPEFDIMRHLKKHFDEDIVFTNFVETIGSTIGSMEAVLLNVLVHPGGMTYGQGIEQGTSFDQAAARVYENNGYETRFVYGGDLSWRNVGNFFSRQGFEHVEGKRHIMHEIPGTKEHVYGAYDRYAYAYVLKKLKEAKRPQFIFFMTTNNHPPFVLEENYQSSHLTVSNDLQQRIIGDRQRFEKRIKDYQYAIDMAGVFMDGVKNSELANDTVVAITADNNTMAGMMHYDRLIELRQVPFYLYLPPYLRGEEPDIMTPGSQKDIFPTLYNRTLSETTYRAIGSDLFNKDVLHCGFNMRGVIVSSDGTFTRGEEKSAAEIECAKQYKAALAINELIVTEQ